MLYSCTLLWYYFWQLLWYYFVCCCGTFGRCCGTLSVAVVLPNKGTENSTTSVLGILAVPLPLISGHKGTQTILTALPKPLSRSLLWRILTSIATYLPPRKVPPPPPRKVSPQPQYRPRKDHWNSFCIVLCRSFWTYA